MLVGMLMAYYDPEYMDTQVNLCSGLILLWHIPASPFNSALFHEINHVEQSEHSGEIRPTSIVNVE